MKIFFDHQIFFLQKYGGVSKYFFNLNKQLNILNINSKIYAPISINSYLRNKKEFSVNHIYLEKIYRFTTRFSLLYNDFFTKIFLNKFNPDIAHLTYFRKNIKIKKKQPIVITVYDLIYEKYFYYYNLKENNKFKKNYLNTADHIICISNSTREDLIYYYNINPDKISVIYLGIDDFQDKQNYLTKSLNNQKKFILYVGNRRRYKNFEILLKAFSLSKNLKQDYQIVCVGGGAFLKQELENIKKKNLLNIVIYSKANDLELNELYKSASLFISTSLCEGFGLPTLEAMSSKCLVLASNIKVYKELLKEYAIFFDPTDEKDLKNKLESILYNNNTNAEIIEKAFKYSRTFTWKKCALETLNIYEKLT